MVESLFISDIYLIQPVVNSCVILLTASHIDPHIRPLVGTSWSSGRVDSCGKAKGPLFFGLFSSVCVHLNSGTLLLPFSLLLSAFKCNNLTLKGCLREMQKSLKLHKVALTKMEYRLAEPLLAKCQRNYRHILPAQSILTSIDQKVTKVRSTTTLNNKKKY